MITREQNGMTNLLRELRKEIRAEVEEATKRHLSAFSKDDELVKDEELNTDDHVDKQRIGDRNRLILQ